MSTYEAEVTRDDGVWAVVVHGLPPHTIGATDVEHFADLGDEVHELIAALTQTDLDSFDIAWRFVMNGQDVTAEIMQYNAAELALQSASGRRDEARRAVIKALMKTNLSQTAIGDVLGLSHQRVHQLAAGR
jgi:DNA-directed RNA polymerase specialized sigma subunit